MQPKTLTTFASPEPSGGRRWEYELQHDTLRIRLIRRWETVETSIPLLSFKGEEIRRTFRLPFSPWTEAAQGGIFCGCALMLCWLVVEVAGTLKGIWERALFGIFGFGLIVAGGALMGVRYLRHDWREWRSVEFRWNLDGEYYETVCILSDESNYHEQDRFLDALRAQIQKARSQPVSE